MSMLVFSQNFYQRLRTRLWLWWYNYWKSLYSEQSSYLGVSYHIDMNFEANGKYEGVIDLWSIDPPLTIATSSHNTLSLSAWRRVHHQTMELNVEYHSEAEKALRVRIAWIPHELYRFCYTRDYVVMHLMVRSLITTIKQNQPITRDTLPEIEN